MTQQPPPDGPEPRRRRHLIDPDNPPPRQQSSVSLTRVQQWVASSVLFVVGMGMSIPLAAISPFIEDDQGAPGAAVGLWVMSVVSGIATIAGILFIHQHRLLSPWLILGVLPAVVVLPLM